MPKYLRVPNYAKLCTTVSKIKLYFFQQPKIKPTHLGTVWHSFISWIWTVLHTLALCGTNIFSARVVMEFSVLFSSYNRIIFSYFREIR